MSFSNLMNKSQAKLNKPVFSHHLMIYECILRHQERILKHHDFQAASIKLLLGENKPTESMLFSPSNVSASLCEANLSLIWPSLGILFV